jgi:ubiquinone/menaquinone biosynthesis C-methylase UbiE
MEPGQTRADFDDIAKSYDQEIPAHMREHYCAKKVSFIIRKLKEFIPGAESHAVRGLDCGCGTGRHVKRFTEEGFVVDGIDVSSGMIEAARSNNRDTSAIFYVGSADTTPFPDETYDFVYLINVLHHITGIGRQKKALHEIRRILKKGGLLFISEVNEDLLPVQWYVKYIFPLTNRIHADSREEEYRTVKEVIELAGDHFHIRDIGYFSFFPNITPAWTLSLLRKVEHHLEERINHRFGGHWLMTLQKSR